ncbi:MAG: FtsQ-type POTRA domain-containing protein [Victivallales bacterium]|nr:FtsQ-type POTRA domain-containing protein [Victivallales bacterium]
MAAVPGRTNFIDEIMAVRGKSRVKTTGKTISRRWRMLLAMVAVLMLAAAAAASFWLVKSFLFSRNNHFRLHRVQVSSTGWWNGRVAKVREILDLPSDDVNLFLLDLRRLRAKLEDQPSIREAEVDRVLPDRLDIHLIERIPRAYLNESGSTWVIDDAGMVMDRDSCIRMAGGIPVIHGLDPKLRLFAGGQLSELQPVLNLIMMTITEFSDMRIQDISVNNPRQLTLILYYNGISRRYKVIFPVNRIHTPSDIREMLYRLRSVIRTALRNGNNGHVINLGFSGQAVIR